MRRTSHKRIAIGRWVFGAAALALLAVFFIWHSFFSGVVGRIAAPIISHNPLATLGATVKGERALQDENAALRAALASTSAVLADRGVLYTENIDLKTLLGRDASMHTLLAGVIMRPPATPYDTLVVDAGARSGVLQGSLVFAGGTTVIGQVDAVYPTQARVVLFSAPGESYQALLMQSAAHATVPLVVVGKGGGTMTAQVPAGTGATAGDTVVLSGIVGGYQSSVVAVDAPKGESFETLYLRLPMNPQELRFVEIAK